MAKDEILFGCNERMSRKVRKCAASCMNYMLNNTDWKSRHFDMISLLCLPKPNQPYLWNLHKAAQPQNATVGQVHQHEEILRMALWKFSFKSEICASSTSCGKKNKRKLSGETSLFQTTYITSLRSTWWDNDMLENTRQERQVTPHLDLQKPCNHLLMNKLYCSLFWNRNLLV